MYQRGGKLTGIFGKNKGYYKDRRTSKGDKGKRRPYLFTIGENPDGTYIDINERKRYFEEGMIVYRKYFDKKLWEGGKSISQLFKEYSTEDQNNYCKHIACFENYTETQGNHATYTDGRTLLFIPFMIHFNNSKEDYQHVTMEVGEVTKAYSKSHNNCGDSYGKVHFGFYPNDKEDGGLSRKIGFYKTDKIEDILCLSDASKRDLVRAFIYCMRELNTREDISHWGERDPVLSEENYLPSQIYKDEQKQWEEEMLKKYEKDKIESGVISSKLSDIGDIDHFKEKLKEHILKEPSEKIDETIKVISKTIGIPNLLRIRELKKIIKNIKKEIQSEEKLREEQLREEQ